MAIIPIIMLIEFKSSSIGKLFILLISIICIPKMANPKKITVLNSMYIIYFLFLYSYFVNLIF